jgi:MFS transporter, YNFM family, putative membrane transport protein
MGLETGEKSAPASAAVEEGRSGAFLQRRTPAYLRVNIAFMAAGLSTFALLYCAQPLLPVFSAAFGVSPATSSLSLSLSTLTLAFSLLLAGRMSDAFGRKRIMAVSLFAAAALTIACAFAPNWNSLLVLRAVSGIAMSGVPSIAMAYLAEEVHPRDLGGSIGLYIAGNAIGGMSGRLLTGFVVDWTGSWRLAMASIGAVGLVSAIVFTFALPPSRRFVAEPGLSLGVLGRALARHLRDEGMLLLYLQGFLLAGGFVTIYNYASYRLLAPPFELSQAAVGAIFLAYIFGGQSSAVFGRLGTRVGRGKMLCVSFAVMAAGLLLTIPASLVAIIGGIVVVTIGFFGGHASASGWVSQRAKGGRAQATSLYLFAYYTGSSIVGSVGGLFWSYWGWLGITGLVAGLILIALMAALRLQRIERLDAAA